MITKPCGYVFYCCKGNNILLKYKEIKQLFFNKKDVNEFFFAAVGTFHFEKKEKEGGYRKNRKKQQKQKQNVAK